MASNPHGEARLAGLDQELQGLRMRLDAIRRGIVLDGPAASVAPAIAPVAPASVTPAAPDPRPQDDDEVLARLRGLLEELKAVTGESP